MACLVTDEIEFTEEPNWPPSIETSASALYPLNKLIVLDQEDLSGEDLMFQVEIRDPNVEQDLFGKVYLDGRPVPVREPRIDPQRDEMSGEFSVQRRFVFTLSPTEFSALGCHRMELRVTSEFSFGTPDPVELGDLATATWWVATISETTTSIDPRLCPR